MGRKKDKVAEELRKIKKEQKQLYHIYVNKITAKVMDTLGPVSEGKPLNELTGIVLKKNHVTTKDTKLIYAALVNIRNSNNTPLVFINGKYGWAENKEQADEWFGNNIHNASKKIIKQTHRIPKGYKALGIKSDPYAMLSYELKKDGIQLIGENK